MEQTNVAAPDITTGSGYSVVYSIYLHSVAYLLRKATALYTGPSELFTSTGLLDTPGLGEGFVKYSVCLAAEHIRSIKPLPLVLVIEGGGFVLGQPSDGARNVHHLSKSLHAIILSVDYAKSPRYPYPHALLQLYSVLQWCLSPSATTKELGIAVDPSRVAIMGNSAGGNLTAALSLLTAFTEGPCAKFRNNLPKGYRQVAQILLYPSLACNEFYRVRFADADAEAQAKSLPVWAAELMEACYLPPTVNKDQIFIAPLLARLELLEEMRENISPVLCYVAGLDCLKNEAIRYCQKLEGAGVRVESKEYAHAIHGFSHFKEGDGEFRKRDVEDCWDSIALYLQEAFKDNK